VRGREAFHELDRLAQLHLHDDGEIAIPAQPFEVEAGDAAEPFNGVRDVDQCGPSFGDGVLHRPLEDRHQQVVLAAEVEVDCTGRDAATRDVGDLGLEVAVLANTLMAARRMAPRRRTRGGLHAQSSG
jgi:hypothetical protein